MKIGIVGSGALGCYYGAKLARAGEEVHLLLRSDYQVVRERGLRVLSPDGNFEARPHCAMTPGEIGPCDVLFIGLKTTANHQFPHLLPPMLGEKSLAITLQNGLGNEEALARVIPEERVLGGLCFVCLNRIEPGVIQHTGFGRVVLGEYRRPAAARTRDLAALFTRAEISCGVSDDLEKTHWEKLVWNIPFNGLGTAGAAGYEAVVRGELEADGKAGPCLTTDRLLDAGRWETLVRDLMAETVSAANAAGVPLGGDVIEKQIERTRAMGAYRASTLIDYENGKPLEIESMFRFPLRRGQDAGARLPRLAALCRLLEQIDPGRTHNFGEARP